jgi:hypothetical protein
VADILDQIKKLVAAGEVRVSRHGFRELAADAIPFADVVSGVPAAVQVEEYPLFGKGPCVLTLQQDAEGEPVHVVWGISKEQTGPAVLVTAYRPDPKRWSEDFKRRKGL